MSAQWQADLDADVECGCPTRLVWVRCPRHCDGGLIEMDTPVGVSTVTCSCFDGLVPRAVCDA